MGVGLKEYSILEDSVFNNTRSFRFSKYNNDWMTFSEEDQILYILVADTNRVYMDFNIPTDSSFVMYRPFHGFLEVTAKEKQFNWIDTRLGVGKCLSRLSRKHDFNLMQIANCICI